MPASATTPTDRREASPAGARQTALLTAGVLAGPLWIAVVVVQALTREGFDFTRHPASVLSNGELGWIQIANFVICGLMFTAAGLALRGRLSGRGARWTPRLLALMGIGMVASGFFVADPLDGFPPGTPAGVPQQVSWHGALHFVSATISFLALIAAAIVLARRFSAQGDHGFAAYSAVSAGLFLAAWLALIALPGVDAAFVAFALAVVVMFAWTSAVYARFRRAARAQAP